MIDELARLAGQAQYPAVAAAIRRFDVRVRKDAWRAADREVEHGLSQIDLAEKPGRVFQQN